jgi:gluconolactonase
MHPSLTIFDRRAEDFIHTGFEVETLSDDCGFTEGPVWNPDGYYLFSDIPANCIYKIDPAGRREIFVEKSGTDQPHDPDLNATQIGSNGLAYDAAGNLLVCRHGAHSIARYDGRKMTELAGSFRGHLLNSPNDLILHSDGRLFFSDPPYGLRDGKLNPDRYQERAFVFMLTGGKLQMICDRYQYPNGVCLSPDEKMLFICSNKPFEQFVSMYDTRNMKYMGIFAEENGDGIDIDRACNIYLCNKDGILILDTRGKRLALITLPAVPANICWGGKDGKDLMICARQNIFLIRGLMK